MEQLINLIAGRIAKKQKDLGNIVALQERHNQSNNLLQVTILNPQTALIQSEITFLQILEKEASHERSY
jgi:hypothetical protein